MRCARRVPLKQLLVSLSLGLVLCSRVDAQPAPAPTPPQPAPPAAPAAPAAQQAPPAVPPAPGAPVELAPVPAPEAPSGAPAPEPPAAEPAPPTAAEAAETIELPAEGATELVVGSDVTADTATPAAATEPESGDIVVTGSRIKRSPELTSSVPVQILDRKQLERTGATNAADVVSMLTTASGSGYQGAGSPGNQGGGAFGTVMINLRGLGPGATLILVNGRRLVPSGGSQSDTFADLSVIPFTAIERVEILKGGGSAIYGADAIAGVVNVITRGSFDGLRLEADGQTTMRGDQQDLTLSGSWGARTEHARVAISTSYMRREGMTSDLREFGRVANVDQSGSPATYIIPGLDPSTPMRTRFVDPACESVEGSEIRHPMTNGTTLPDEICAFNYSKFQSILPDLERGNIFGSGSYDFSNHTTLFTELLVNRTRSDVLGTPSFSVPPPFLTVPADHVDNPFGRGAGFLGRPLGASYGPQHQPYSDDTYRVVAGLRGDFADVAKESFAESWEWELTGSWGLSRYTTIVADSLRQRLQAALNSCSDPSNLTNCFNPFYSAIDGTGTPNSQAVVDGFFGQAMAITDHALQMYNGTLTGSMFEMPGGDAGFALGGEIRHESRMTNIDHDSNQQAYSFILGNPDAYAERSVYSGFLEIRWPLYPGIELNTAARVEHYTDIDDTTPSPFGGLTLVPAEILGRDNVGSIWQRLQFTGQATWAFRAPSLIQSGPGHIIVPTALTIPPGPVPVYTPVRNLGNPDLDPETALVLSAGTSWQPIDELTLMLEYWDYQYRDRIAIESSQQALANDIALMAMGGNDPRVIHDPATNAIQRIDVTFRNIDGEVRTNGIDFGTMVTLTGKTFGGGVNDFGAFNLGLQGTLTLSYSFPSQLAARRVIPNTAPTMTLDPLHCDGDSCEAVGSRNYQTFAPPMPRWKFNIPLGWSMNGHMVSVIGHYVSGIEDDNAIAPDGSVGHLSGQLTIDAQYGYTVKDWIGKELAIRVGVYNIFDVLPEQTRDLNGFETMLYDPRGAMAYAKVSATF